MLKKRLWIILALCFAVFSSCDDNKEEDDRIWDFAKYDAEFVVKDADGRNLLDPATSGNILDNEIKVSYEGETYDLCIGKENCFIHKHLTRDLPAFWYGLRICEECRKYHEEKSVMMFGEFSPTDNHRSKTFTINWGDGSSDEITFDLYITWKKNDPTVHKNIWLNGVEHDSFLFEFIK